MTSEVQRIAGTLADDIYPLCVCFCHVHVPLFTHSSIVCSVTGQYAKIAQRNVKESMPVALNSNHLPGFSDFARSVKGTLDYTLKYNNDFFVILRSLSVSLSTHSYPTLERNTLMNLNNELI